MRALASFSRTVCADEKTSIPASGDSQYRIDLVSDLLTFNMRETNQLEKELSLSRGQAKECDLDNRIAKYKERLEKKPWYSSRKLENERRRLRSEENILNAAKETAKLCLKNLNILENTRVGKITSDEYDDLHDVLVKGARLGETSNINEIIEFHKKLTKVSDQYILTHDSVVGPLTEDGRTRLKISKLLAERGKTAGKEIEEKSLQLREKDMPLNKRIEIRKASVEHLNRKREEELEANRQNNKNKVENAKKKVESAKKKVEENQKKNKKEVKPKLGK